VLGRPELAMVTHRMGRGPVRAWRADTAGMAQHVERHHWVNTLCGILDSAFYLDDAELVGVVEIVSKLLAYLHIPARGEPAALSPGLVSEATGSYYAISLSSRDYGLVRAMRAAGGNDCVVSLEAWREALLRVFTTAYPDLNADERFVAVKVLTDLLAAIGVPGRAAAHHPQEVVDAYLRVDRATI